MLKILICVVGIIATVACLPTVNDQGVEEPVDKPGYCHIKDVYIKEGEQGPGPIGQCRRYKCISVADRRMSFVTCPGWVPREGCHKSEHDLTKQYPACCPKEICPDEITNKD
ncbi:hypothetical protein ILUMI_18219 [Ignelater luminosus]|uniref:Single domain-containing protein n=1 Tax=Ignelater luminosus TaxID=2038154 RepID=A0A8K0G6L4_IGNLU|nr:hypothetical protein ILUMI_18219 [Ignelater luminosus]